MKRVLLIGSVLLAIACATSACGSGGRARVANDVVHHRPAPGHLVGFVHYSHGGAETPRPNTNGLVVVYDLRGRVVARRHVRRGHYFNVRLAPGRYRLGFNRRPPKDTGGCPARVAVVHPGRKTFQVLQLNCSLL